MWVFLYLPEVGAVGVDDCGGVVEEPVVFLLVDGHNDHHFGFLGQGEHALHGRARPGPASAVPRCSFSSTWQK